MSRSVPFAANPLLQVRLPALRSRIVMLLVACAFLALAVRAVHLQVLSNDFLQRQGEVRYGRTVELPASRGKLLDRNGAVLAASLPARAIWASPEDFRPTAEQLSDLARLLQMPERAITKLLANEDRSFVYLKRQVDVPVAARIDRLGIPGLHQLKEYKRYYPEADPLAHVVGFTSVDNRGQEGMELARESVLAGKPGSRRVIRDGRGRTIEHLGLLRQPHDGRDLHLSIDSKIQFHAFSALRDAIVASKAKAGAVVVLDVRTGEVLALANLPTYNPNARGQLSGAQLRNRVITDTFEPGSTLKPFAILAALESGKFRPNSIIDTGPGRMMVGKHTIHDTQEHGVLSLEQVLQKSSNVGTAKIALALPPHKIWEIYSAVGFGQAPDIGFPGAVAGRLRPHKKWRPIEQATMSYGHGISVSLLQLARAYTLFARDGDIVPLTMMRTDEPAQGVPVVSSRTNAALRKMLEMATDPDGT
ncbi:MAG: penicillin-binding protein 2, partial [Quisquiliibacterium sp.]